MKRLLFPILALVLVLALAVPVAAHTEEHPATADLVAGQHITVGEVRVWNDGTTLYVEYAITDPDWEITETHVHVAGNATDIPQTQAKGKGKGNIGGNPIPGHFAQAMAHDPGVGEYTYEFDLEENGFEPCNTVCIAAHAAVVNATDPEYLWEETAWAAGLDFPGKNWATYFEYHVQFPMELSGTGTYTAEWQTDPDYYRSAPTSAHLAVPAFTPGGSADEARIVIGLPSGTTLGDIQSISWWEHLVGGYPPHLDIYLDIDGGGWGGYPGDDILIFEYAYNGLNHYTDGPPSYGALTGTFYQTFNDDGVGPAQVDDTTPPTGVAKGWPGSGPAGPPASIELHTLAEWQAGVSYTTYSIAKTVDADTPVLWLEIEIDNWITATECYVDDIAISLA